MIVSDNKELSEACRKDLENWGRWCRDDWEKHLGYTPQPMFKYYRAPRQEVTKVRMPVDVDRAELANDAILRIGLESPPDDKRRIEPFTVFNFIVAKWAKGKSTAVLAHQFKCSERTVRNHTIRAIQCFFDMQQRIVLEKKKNAA